MTSRRSTSADFRSPKAVRRPGKDHRQTEIPGGQPEKSCQTSRRRSFSFDDQGFKQQTYLGSIEMQFIGYTAASSLAFLFDVSLLLLLSGGWLLNPAVSAALAFMGGLALNFLMCRYLVFRQARSGRADVQFGGFLLTGLVGLALTVLAVHVLVSIAGLSLLVSKLVAAAVVLVLNYVARAHFVFKSA